MAEMSDAIEDQRTVNQRLIAEAKLILASADEAAAQSLYDDIVDLMTASEVSKATMFAVVSMVVSTWVSAIPCAGCRTVEIARMGLLAQETSNVLARQNGGDDAESYHATRH